MSITPPTYRHDRQSPLRPINWNNIVDDKDLEVWNRLTSNFWLPEKVPISNDLPSWNSLTDVERDTTMKVFTGLTMLDTVQATVGELSQVDIARTEHEEAVYTNIAFMQSVHARSYSSIFSTLCSTSEINRAYTWAVGNELVQERSRAMLDHYVAEDPLKSKASTVLLSSFLLYAGFYLPLRFSSQGKLMNTADMIRLILRDKAVHGYYSGYKYQQSVAQEPRVRREELAEFVKAELTNLYNLELRFTEEIFSPLGIANDVAVFVRYNANKALMNLGYSVMFPEDEVAVEPAVLAALAPGSEETHDFFSGSGSSYVVGQGEVTTDEDWTF